MNDLELQALWQAQPRALPSAFSTAELEGRSPPPASLTVATGEFEETRLERQVELAVRRARLAVGLCVVALLAAMLVPTAWLAVAAASFVVVGWQARRIFLADRALRAVRVLRERPGNGSSARVPLLAFGAVVLMSLAAYVVTDRAAVRRQRLDASVAALPGAEAVDAWAATCGAASARLPDAELEAAAASCEKALQYATLHHKAVSWARYVIALGECPRAMSRVTTLFTRGEVTLALEAWERVPPACAARASAGWPLQPEQLDRLLALERQRCLNAKAGTFEFESCRAVALLSCHAPDGDAEPPAGRVFQPDGPLGEAGWRPEDPAMLRFLLGQRDAARAGGLLQPKPWVCPRWVGLRARPARQADDQPFSSAAWPEALQPALQAWMNGDEAGAMRAFEAATVPHPVREAFARDFGAVRQAYAEARSRLAAGADAPADTAATVRAALDADARFLVRGEPSPEQLRSLAKYERAPRVQLSRAMGAAEYQRGRRLADQKNFRHACLAWKAGAAFTRADLDLLKALTQVCTPMARRKLDDAQGCAELREVLDFAVDGDGLADRARARLAADRCP